MQNVMFDRMYISLLGGENVPACKSKDMRRTNVEGKV